MSAATEISENIEQSVLDGDRKENRTSTGALAHRRDVVAAPTEISERW